MHQQVGSQARDLQFSDSYYWGKAIGSRDRMHAAGASLVFLLRGAGGKGGNPTDLSADDLLGKTVLGGKVSPLACSREMAAKGVTLIRMLCRGYVAHASQDNKDANDTFAVQVV